MKMRLESLRLLSKSFSRSYSRDIPLPSCDFTPKPYKGPSVQSLKKLKQTRAAPTIIPHYSEPLHIHQGYKQWLFDFEGRRYLDMFGGVCTVSVGHSHPRITETVAEQISTVGHLANIYITPKMYEFAEKLTDTFPGDLKVAYFVNSGTEANDLAILLARAYTQNFDVIALRNGYHGINNSVMSLTSGNFYRQHVPTAAGFHHAMNPNVYTGLWGGQNCKDSPAQTNRKCDCPPNACEASKKYAEQLTEVYNYAVPVKRVAAFFAESIQGVGGIIQFPKGYIKKAYEAVNQNGGLFIADEVQSGFGRTGEYFWGFESHGIVPDIVTMAKGIGNGFPLAAVVTRLEIAQALTKAAYFNTFGGNPLACAVGNTVLDIIKDEKLQHNSKVVGTYLINKLLELRSQYPAIGDVRGQGLMIGFEMISPDGKSAPLDQANMMKFWDKCRHSGLLIGKGGFYQNVFRLQPPMCVTKEDADFTVAVIKKALKDCFGYAA